MIKEELLKIPNYFDFIKLNACIINFCERSSPTVSCSRKQVNTHLKAKTGTLRKFL